MITERYLTITDLAQILRLSKTTVYHKHKSWIAGGLKAIKIDGARSYRFPASSFHAWANRQRAVL